MLGRERGESGGGKRGNLKKLAEIIICSQLKGPQNIVLTQQPNSTKLGTVRTIGEKRKGGCTKEGLLKGSKKSGKGRTVNWQGE